MNFAKMSTPGLLLLHGAIAHALAADDNTPKEQEKVYGVREFPDWRSQSDLIEAVLDARKATYSPILW